jgi:hypothetical protein
VQTLLLKAAVEYAKRRGAKIVEGYPVDSKSTNIPDVSSFVGLASVFRRVGFVEVARRSGRQAVMRYVVEE